ncbi:DUF6977 family protein [Psychrobacter sp. I-STPA6b]|uniref:DarT1-associated NADAR antitoxin family protein n=1 Tax=Psychrobacter sp. I-STPA6b TaxID=2585718 RepID=UPI0039B5552D
MTALNAHPEYHQPLLSYDAFTDIEFNPKKSINCQVHAVALFCALLKVTCLMRSCNHNHSFYAFMMTQSS